MLGQDTDLPHALVPLVLAVSLVRSKLCVGAATVAQDSNGLATFIASKVPVFEYFDDPNWRPRPLTATWQDGVFRGGGAELRFFDGQRSKHLLAVLADDIECVINMLNDPASALQTRARALVSAAAKARRNARAARSESARLRAEAHQARLFHSWE